MRTPRQDSARTRQSLLAAAGEVFAEKGYRDATIAEISERAGTNIAAVNYHFGDKETLYREAWRHSFQESLRNHPPEAYAEGCASPRDRLSGEVRALLRRVTDADNKSFLMVYKELANPTGLLEEAMREEIWPIRRRIQDSVRQVLGTGTPEPLVRHCAVSIVSQCIFPAFINMAEGAVREERESWRISDVETYADHVVAFSFAGMSAAGARAVRVARRTRRAAAATGPRSAGAQGHKI